MKSKTFRILALLLLFSVCTALFASCGAKNGMPTFGRPNIGEEKGIFDLEGSDRDEFSNEEGQATLIENDFILTSKENVSTFSANINTATYSYFRKLVGGGATLEQIRNEMGSYFRTEEMINYFKYSLNAPAEGELFGRTVEIGNTPWNQETKLMMLGLKTKEATVHAKNNLVFLIDVSGSMSDSDKLGLLQKTFSYLTNQLGEDDVVSIVTYASGERVVLDGCRGNKTDTILKAIKSPSQRGSTNGEAEYRAYQLAAKHLSRTATTV